MKFTSMCQEKEIRLVELIFLILTQSRTVLFLYLTTVVKHKLTRLTPPNTEQQHAGRFHYTAHMFDRSIGCEHVGTMSCDLVPNRYTAIRETSQIHPGCLARIYVGTNWPADDNREPGYPLSCRYILILQTSCRKLKLNQHNKQ